MTDYRSESSIGARIRAARRKRGFRLGRDLVKAMPGSNITASTLENIESGRKNELSISQLLNIARALAIPPSYLLAPMGTPGAELDLPNLGDAFTGMSAAEFDSWLCSIPTGGYRPLLAAERTDIDQLNTLRELQSLRRELTRLRAVLEVETGAKDSKLAKASSLTKSRLASTRADIRRLEAFLVTAGWDFEPTSETP